MRQLLYAAVEEHEVVHQLNQPILAAHPKQILVQLETGIVVLGRSCAVLGARDIGPSLVGIFLPLEEILFRRADGALLQILGIISGEDALHRAEEPFIELGLLVREVLPDAVANRHTAVLQLQHADGDAIHV